MEDGTHRGCLTKMMAVEGRKLTVRYTVALWSAATVRPNEEQAQN